MKIFIVGGTGVLGKRLVPLLIDEGHVVNVLSRSEENTKKILEMGGNAVVGSLYDENSLKRASSGNEIFLHLATKIPTETRPSVKNWQENSRLRTEGVENLINVAIFSSCKFYLQQSITFHYGDRSGEWVDETDEVVQPVSTHLKLSKKWQEITDNSVVMEGIVNDAIEKRNLPATILRFGWFYSHDSANIPMIAKRGLPIIGNGLGYWNLISVDDAVGAIANSIKHYQRCIGKTLNIVDDKPATVQEIISYGTEKATGRKPRRFPKFLARFLLGAPAINFFFNSVRVKNTLAKQVLDWKPQYPTFKEGFDYELQKLQ
ncbi:MAG: NAD-dependent epimerase/dehydratase family protein [Candidatus Kariarchaeaceae archaeon]|jgi:nucleoside-diphosphate-sugar epimerase